MVDPMDRRTPSLGGLLNQLKAQVLATRDVPAEPRPGEVIAQSIYDAAETARYEALPHP